MKFRMFGQGWVNVWLRCPCHFWHRIIFCMWVAVPVPFLAPHYILPVSCGARAIFGTALYSACEFVCPFRLVCSHQYVSLIAY
jgi:hypothetical protein